MLQAGRSSRQHLRDCCGRQVPRLGLQLRPLSCAAEPESMALCIPGSLHFQPKNGCSRSTALDRARPLETDAFINNNLYISYNSVLLGSRSRFSLARSFLKRKSFPTRSRVAFRFSVHSSLPTLAVACGWGCCLRCCCCCLAGWCLRRGEEASRHATALRKFRHLRM